MEYKFDKPNPPTLTLTLDPEEVILLRTLFGWHIAGNETNPIRRLTDNIHRACAQYMDEYFPGLATGGISDLLIELNNKIYCNKNTWSLDK